MAIGGTKVVQVTNIAPQATKDQMQTLFGYLGKIDDIRLYPTIRDVSCPVQSRICYIKFMESVTVGIAQHMTNTVFIDRALIVIPVQNGDIPDEYFALEMTRNGTIVPGLCAAEPNLPPHVVNTITNLGAGQVIITYDPKLEANGLPPYPPLPANYDSNKIEEIRRTVLMVNVDPSTPTEEYIDFFTSAGEVKYLRQCTRASDSNAHMLLEFNDQPSIIEVLKMNGKEFKGQTVRIVHATQAIVKPQAKSNEAAQREIEEAMSRVKEAQNLISATIDPVIGMLSKDKRSGDLVHGRDLEDQDHVNVLVVLDHIPDDLNLKIESIAQNPNQDVDRGHVPVDHSLAIPNRRNRHKSKERGKSRDKSKEKEKRSQLSRDRDRSRERDRKSRDRDNELKEKRSEKDGPVEMEEKRSSKKRSLSPVRGKFRSHSRDRKIRSRSRDRRSRSRGRRHSPSPRPLRRRSRTKSRDRDQKRDKRDRKERKERSPSLPKSSRNYDEEERGYDSERGKRRDYGDPYDFERDKDSPEKSDNMDISNSP
ncbi:hypothetical protein PPYR_00155 [Photinus pyralis]|uniref:RRM domain-containing protein n=1 Tax=Photinus pyralis TaxID=7054 RepID=A0A5N4B0S0_PHOPY|nr:hypothetical protein PPYR_00155 [Photinus pyralis]